jgi:mRNA interferase MazF
VTSAKLFGVYTAQFQFLEGTGSKIRPVIVVSKPYGPHAAIAIVPVSSRPAITEIDFALGGWVEAGLLRPSTARVHRITTMLQGDLLAELGILGTNDVESLRSALHRLFEL